MLFKTYHAFHDHVEYSRNADGSWKAEFHGPIDIVVVGRTLERCRFVLSEALDEKLEEFISASYNVSVSRHGSSA
jgi:hypothetical protein